MSLYPIHYFDDKDYDMPEIAIFHAHYPHIKIQYAEISFRVLGSMRGAEFQVMDCNSDYLLFVLSVIWRLCFGGAAIEREEARQKMSGEQRIWNRLARSLKKSWLKLLEKLKRKGK